jgi:hypothetical protein
MTHDTTKELVHAIGDRMADIISKVGQNQPAEKNVHHLLLSSSHGAATAHNPL